MSSGVVDKPLNEYGATVLYVEEMVYSLCNYVLRLARTSRSFSNALSMVTFFGPAEVANVSMPFDVATSGFG